MFFVLYECLGSVFGVCGFFDSLRESVFGEGLRVFQGFRSDQEIDREGLVFGFCVNRRGRGYASERGWPGVRVWSVVILRG